MRNILIASALLILAGCQTRVLEQQGVMRVEPSTLAGNSVPDQLNPNQACMGLTEADAVRTRTFEIVRKHDQWTINGRTWADVIASNFTLLEAHPGANDVEIWQFKNDSGGWFHPVHVHLVDFRILDRNGRPQALPTIRRDRLRQSARRNAPMPCRNGRDRRRPG